MKKLPAILQWTMCLALTAALLPGCDKASNKSHSSFAAGATGPRLLGLSLMTMNDPFFVALNKGLKNVVESHGDRLVTLDSQFNSLKQKNDISDLIHQGVAAIFINPVNWQGIKGSLVAAREKNIPCIVVDGPVEDAGLVLTTVASDNLQAGELAARALAQVRPRARLVILDLPISKACLDRVAGFKRELALHPEMQILDMQDCKGTTEGGRPVMKDLLGRYPELDGAFAINDQSALGAISAIDSAGRSGFVAVVSVDGSEDGRAAIRSGKLVASAAQFSSEIGRTAAEKIYDYFGGKPVDKDIKVKVSLITKTNVDRTEKQD